MWQRPCRPAGIQFLRSRFNAQLGGLFFLATLLIFASTLLCQISFSETLPPSIPLTPESVGPDLSELGEDDSNSNAEYLLLTQFAEQSLDTKKSIHFLSRRLLKYPSAPDRIGTLRKLARLYLRVGQPEYAEPLLEEVTQLEDARPKQVQNLKQFVKDRLLLSRAYLHQNKTHQALLTLKPVRVKLAAQSITSGLFPYYVESLLLETMGFRLQGNSKMAKLDFENAGQKLAELQTEFSQAKNAYLGLNFDYRNLKISFKIDDCTAIAQNHVETPEALYIQEMGNLGTCVLEAIQDYDQFGSTLHAWTHPLSKHQKTYPQNWKLLWSSRQSDFSELLETYDNRCQNPPLPPENTAFTTKQKRQYISELSAQLRPGCRKTVEIFQKIMIQNSLPLYSSTPELTAKTKLVLGRLKEVKATSKK